MSMELSLPIEDSLGVTLRNRDITEDALLSKVAEAYSKRAQLDDPEFKGDRHDLLLEIKNTDREVLELMAERGFLDVSIKAQLKQETR